MAKKTAKPAAKKAAAKKKVSPKKETVEVTPAVEEKPKVEDVTPSTPPEEVSAPAVTPSEDKPSKKKKTKFDLSEKVTTYVTRVLHSYFTKEGITDAKVAAVMEALANGEQPLVVEGKGNFRFAVKFDSSEFSPRDASQDATTDGVFTNLARACCDARLYPR